jgi:hypothetical protein
MNLDQSTYPIMCRNSEAKYRISAPRAKAENLEDGMAGRPRNPWDTAAACEAHAQTTKDQKLREKFRRLRDTWIRIANNDALAGNEPRGPAASTKK